MNIKTLTSDLSVMPQIEVADLEELARRGFRSIIGNRPDGEAPDQPRWTDVKGAALAVGMEAVHIPVVASQIGEADIRAFGEAIERLPKPIAAFCRTGTRSAILWALANKPPKSAGERIRIAQSQGYDLEPFRVRMEEGDAVASSPKAD